MKNILAIFGIIFSGLLVHETYHLITKKQVELCVTPQGFYVKGYGGSSEIIAYILMGLTIILLAYLTFRKKKGKW